MWLIPRFAPAAEVGCVDRIGEYFSCDILGMGKMVDLFGGDGLPVWRVHYMYTVVSDDK